MESDLKNLIIAGIVAVVIFVNVSIIFSSLVQTNGGSLPTEVASALNNSQNGLQNVNSLLTSANSNSSVALQNNLKATNPFSIFFVFGGIITSLFQYISAIPNAFLTIFGILSNPALVGPMAGVVATLVALATAIIGIMIVWAFIRAITKVEP